MHRHRLMPGHHRIILVKGTTTHTIFPNHSEISTLAQTILLRMSRTAQFEPNHHLLMSVPSPRMVESATEPDAIFGTAATVASPTVGF